jgi:tetratricopeptide (TPR) repeat protein
MSEEWVIIQLDEKVARMHGLPARVPAPKSQFEGIADAGFELPKLKKWITSFLGVAPPAWRSQNPELAKSYDRFVAKADFWERGMAALSKHDVAGAISAFKMISNVDPDDHAAKMNLGLAYAQSGDAEQARKALTAIRATYAGDADYHVALGQALVTLGEKDAAADEFALALEAQPNNASALKALVALGFLVAVYENPRDAASLTYVRKDALLDTVKEIWGEATRDASYYLDQLDYHASEQRHELALAAAEQALAVAGSDAKERAEVGRLAALRGLRRFDEALAQAEKALGAYPRSVRLFVERARIQLEAGRTADADVAIDAALAIDPGWLEALALRFPLERTLSEQSADRIAKMAAWADAHGASAGAWMWLGLLRSKAGAQEDAIDCLKKAVSLAPTDDEIRSAYWAELGQAGRWELVIADASALDMKSRSWKVRWTEAEGYAALGKKVEARAAFTALNADESLPIEIRKRAKRAVDRAG